MTFGMTLERWKIMHWDAIFCWKIYKKIFNVMYFVLHIFFMSIKDKKILENMHTVCFLSIILGSLWGHFGINCLSEAPSIISLPSKDSSWQDLSIGICLWHTKLPFQKDMTQFSTKILHFILTPTTQEVENGKIAMETAKLASLGWNLKLKLTIIMETIFVTDNF